MKLVFVAALLGVCALATSYSINDVEGKVYSRVQQQIWQLYKYVNQPLYYPELVEIAKTYNIEQNVAGYSKPDVVNTFVEYANNEYYLKRGEIFSVYYEEHLQQAIALFKLFYYAKDYETFYKTAVWARQNVNEGMYLYALSVAVVHRPDTYYVVLPPIYEVYPYYFYNSEVISQAQYYKQVYYGKGQQYGRQQEPRQEQYQPQYYGEGKNYQNYDYVIYSNYSGYYLNLQPEQALSYFTEDVGLNAFYYYYNLYYPYWMSGDEYNLTNDKRGQVFYYVYQQILARYYLERLSNGLGEIQYLNWQVPLQCGYYPSLTYPNGLEFPTRPNYVNLYEYFYNYGQKWSYKGIYGYSYTLIQDYESRIRNAIDYGYVYAKDGSKVSLYSEEGLNVLGNIIESNPDSPYNKYYGPYQVFARHLLGYSYQPLSYHKAYPSALEHIETSLRDPVFYVLYKKLILYVQKYKYQQKPYSQDQLYWSGVKVDKVEFERLVTYFGYVYADITNAVYVTPEEMQQNTFKVAVAQKALNHKPFTYKVYVNADKRAEAVVKVYIGPKYDEYGRPIDINENRVNFVQFDNFKYTLQPGQNVIVRNSREIYNYMHDRSTYYQIYQKIMGYYRDYKNYNFAFEPEQILFGFPQRLMLPKGTYGGYPYQFYVIVSPYVPYKYQQGQGAAQYNKYIGTGAQYVDGYPAGYPFDRYIRYEKMFYNIPNAYYYDTKIYHRNAEDVKVNAISYN